MLTQVSAVTVSYLNMRPDRNYMNFAIDRYLKWHDKNLPSKFQRTKLVDELLSHIDHWVVQEKKEFPQFMIGYSTDKNGVLKQQYRIFIHPALRSKFPVSPGYEPWFYVWDEDHGVCIAGKNIKEKEFELKYFCKKNLDKSEIFSTTVAKWPDPFPFPKPWEIRIMENGLLQEIFYTFDSTHPSGIPKDLVHVLVLHGTEGHFPLDKYSITKDGKMTIYFP